jgi:hypothetical protein
MRLALSVAFVTLVAGCIHQPPLVQAPPPSTGWLLPDGSDVLVQVVGTSEIVPTGLDRPGYRALHTKLTFTNAGNRAWIIDPHQQIAHIDMYSISMPSNASAATLVVPPGETHTIDLFYPIPQSDVIPALPMHVRIDWKITQVDGIILHRAVAEFDRSRKYGWDARTRM